MKPFDTAGLPLRVRMAWPLMAAFALLAADPAQAAGKHVHGEMAMDVAIDGPVLRVELRAPLDSLVGFERAPRTAAERQAAAAALARLRDPGSWLKPDAAAGCTAGPVQIEDNLLEPAAKPGDAGDGHADIELAVEWRCASPAALKDIDVALFEAFPRTERIDVQVAGGGPAKQTLRAKSARLRLGR